MVLVRQSLADLIASLHPARRGCPAHPGTRGPSVWRGPEKSYFECPTCHTVYLERFAEDSESYGSVYFTDEYRKQYGRTYVEDFDAIKAVGHRRVDTMMTLKPGIADVLDVGCAYGPFLQAAKERGLSPCGVDVSEEATTYVRDNLGLPAVTASAIEFDPADSLGIAAFDAVTLWFVVEHFQDLSELLTRISRWVKPGGILALSTPCGTGVSGRRNREAFFRDSPRDHFTIWSRHSARRLLGEFGLTIRRIVSTGHHSERYPAVGAGRMPEWIAGLHSRIFGWGDTFEIYAQRSHHG
jgi:2-polyprenyl-3-methyl-5-hydroxy-6-metoxy-1,4-benzoquinol methylase